MSPMKLRKAANSSPDPNHETPSCADASWIEKFSQRFEPKPQYLIPILQFVQCEKGHLTPEALREVARYLRIPESTVFGVATFYAQFHFTPRGRNKVTVCRGTACHVRGSASLLREIENQLGVKPGETTPDQRFTLETVACFGACALAPVVVLNDRVHGRQTSASVKRQIEEVDARTCRAECAPAAARPRPARGLAKQPRKTKNK